MNSARRASGAPSPKDTNVRPVATRNISYPDLPLVGSERVSSESSRSGPINTSTTSRIEDLLAQLKVEFRIKSGAENLLQVYDEQKGQPQQAGKDQLQMQRLQMVESQLDAANAKIQMLKSQLQDLGVARASLDSDRTSFVTDKLSKDILASIEKIEELDTGTLTTLIVK